MILKWAAEVQLDLSPPDIPTRNRYADNWRPLIAIADSLGHGPQARELMKRMTKGLPDEDLSVLLLLAIRDIFNALRVDRIFSADLVSLLHAREGEIWSEWAGVNGDRLPPHPVTQTEVAGALCNFEIVPKTISKLGPRDERGPSARGYKRKQFEQAWASYCPPDASARQHTPALKIVKE
jgi:hypothetical protein